MRIANRTFLPAALVAALLCPLAVQPVEAQSSKPRPPIRAVEVVVRDIAAQEDIGSVQPGGTISIPAGSKVRLIMTAIPTGARQPLYPATTYSDQSRGGVQITRSNSENSTADLAVGNTKGTRTQAIGFQIQPTCAAAPSICGSSRATPPWGPWGVTRVGRRTTAARAPSR
jgi:hypothetical protein